MVPVSVTEVLEVPAGQPVCGCDSYLEGAPLYPYSLRLGGMSPTRPFGHIQRSAQSALKTLPES